MARKERNFDYFDAFEHAAKKSCQAARMLVSILTDFDPERIEIQMYEMHTIEHDADILHHELLRHLAREFITPIEREDISVMAQELDEVTDCIEDVVQRIYMYNIRSIPESALQMGHIIRQCCDAMLSALCEFKNYKKSTKIKDYLIEINRLEEDGDQMYIQGNRKLHLLETDPVVIHAWAATYTRLEKCCDACEHVADVMEGIIMKNS